MQKGKILKAEVLKIEDSALNAINAINALHFRGWVVVVGR